MVGAAASPTALDLPGSVVDMAVCACPAQIVDRDFQRSAEEQQRNSNLKDAMRDMAMPAIAESWPQILMAHQEGDPEICAMCLDTIKVFADWIDISLVVNDTIMPFVFAFLDADPTRRDGASEVLRAVVCKGMDLEAKTALVDSLELVEAITRFVRSGIYHTLPPSACLRTVQTHVC